MHSLGFQHEQTRPDRDDYLTVDWVHTQVFFQWESIEFHFCLKLDAASNHWKNSWTLEDLRAATPCTTSGVSQETANFDNCVGSAIVTDYGVGYDFNSIMHYSLTRLICKEVLIFISESHLQLPVIRLGWKCAQS